MPITVAVKGDRVDKAGAAGYPIGNAMAAAMSMGFVRLSDNSVVVATPSLATSAPADVR